jgi:hypothetical protein
VARSVGAKGRREVVISGTWREVKSHFTYPHTPTPHSHPTQAIHAINKPAPTLACAALAARSVGATWREVVARSVDVKCWREVLT